MSLLPKHDIGLEMVLEALETRFELDARGHIVASRGDGITPRFVLGRSTEGCLWRFGPGLADETVRRVARLAGREPGLPEHDARGVPLASAPGRPPAPPERLEAIARLLTPPADASSGPAAATAHREPLRRAGVLVAELWLLP